MLLVPILQILSTICLEYLPMPTQHPFKSHPSRRRKRRLFLEPLEERMLLAADFLAAGGDAEGENHPQVRIRLEVTDLSGNVITQVDPGDQFLLNQYVKDLRTGLDAKGVFASYADVVFAADMLGVVSAPQFGCTDNADLANDLGNLLSRARALIGRHMDGLLPTPEQEAGDEEVIAEGAALISRVRPLVGELRIFEALETVMQFVRMLNRYFNDEAPWKLAKDPEQYGRLGTVLYNCVEGLRIVSVLMEPAMPGKARQVRIDLGLGDFTFADIEEWGGAQPGTKVPAEAEILFPKTETEKTKQQQTRKKKEQSPKKELDVIQDKGEISIDDFFTVQLRVAQVTAAEKVEKADKLLKLTLDLGDETRTVVSGIAEWYQPEDLPGTKVVLVANLKPAKLRGIVSEGMILTADDGQGNLTLVSPARDIAIGAEVR